MQRRKIKFSGGRIFSNIQLSEFNKDKPVELISSAKQADPYYGDFSYTKEELQEMADNHNSDVAGVEIAVDVNHDPKKKAYAWIEPGSMFVADSKNLAGESSLYAKLYRFTPEGEELVETGAYRYFSIEVRNKVEKFVDGVKQIFNNVIRGLALTNAPVIKDLAPTFSENNLYSNSKPMELLKILLAELAKQETVSLSEKANIKTMLKTLSKEDQEEVKDEVKEVEDKPEQTEEEKKAAEDAEKALSEAKAKAEADKKLAESKMSETERKLAEQTAQIEKQNKELAEIRMARKSENLDKVLSEVTLSEDVKVGFVGEAIKEVKEFAMTLSEEQVKEFVGVIKKIKSVDLSEIGDEGADDGNGDKEDKELHEKAEKLAKDEKIKYSEAISRVYKEAGKTY